MDRPLLEERLQRCVFVTNVRNPSARVLPCYLDKVARNDGNPHRRVLCEFYDIDAGVVRFSRDCRLSVTPTC